MEYIYAALLLHKAGKPIKEESVKAVLTAAGIAVDDARIKALVAALDGVNIEEAISKAAAAPVAVAVAPAAAAGASAAAAPAVAAPAPEDKKEEEESGMAGLGALFG
ncbi:MAG: 50S ribosomal protein P1 [Methanoregulaceae archaeon]|jgi:large subunit ribosomal protein L12|nr:50S ribosomal protein P1 [Methanoregulaceae archaeon]